MPRSHAAHPPGNSLPPQITKDIQRAIAIVVQVRHALLVQAERLNQLEAELLLLVEGPEPLPEPLTPREIAVLRYAAIGETNKEIAARIGIATGTLTSSMSLIYRKLGVRNRNEAAFKAWKLGLI